MDVKWLSLVLGLSLGAGIGCSGEPDDSGGGSEGNVNLIVTSSDLGLSSKLLKERRAKRQSLRNTNVAQGTVVTVGTTCVTISGTEWCNCTIQNQTGQNDLYSGKEGYCATPLNIGGGISAISLAAIGKSGAPSPRILGGGMELSTNKDGELDVNIQDFANADELEGEDTLDEGEAPDGGYTSFTMLLSHIDMKLPPVTSGSTTLYYTMRYVFYTQPLTEEPTVAACGIDTPGMENIEAGSTLLGTSSISRNDVLFCVKDSADATCEHTDFKWLDTTTNGSEVFASARPATASTYQNVVVWDDWLDCSTNSEGIPDMAAGGLGLLGALEAGVEVNATRDGPSKTYEVGGETGSTLNVTLDLDVVDMAFIETAGAGLQAYIDTKIGQSATGSTLAESIHFIPVYIRYKMGSHFNCGNNCSYTERDAGFYGSMSVSVE